MPLRLFLLALLLAFATPVPAQTKAKETCAEQDTQFANIRLCMSSVLAPQAGNTYGPQSIFDGDDKAWCEGVVGYGIGETITLHYKPAVRLQQFSFINGYSKSPEAFHTNSRVKQFRIQTSDGFATVVTVKDTQEDQTIKLPRAVKPAWVRFTILDVYPGTRGSDTCISGIYANLEELNN
jgi:hypothetical protein